MSTKLLKEADIEDYKEMTLSIQEGQIGVGVINKARQAFLFLVRIPSWLLSGSLK
ncbi:hypothetical protein GCM10028819_44730 [Spirosoma humi]